MFTSTNRLSRLLYLFDPFFIDPLTSIDILPMDSCHESSLKVRKTRPENVRANDNAGFTAIIAYRYRAFLVVIMNRALLDTRTQSPTPSTEQKKRGLCRGKEPGWGKENRCWCSSYRAVGETTNRVMIHEQMRRAMGVGIEFVSVGQGICAYLLVLDTRSTVRGSCSHRDRA